MSGFFAVASKTDCITDLFYGTDYHSHLGTKRGGLVSLNDQGFCRYIHNIENTQFRSKFEDDIHRMSGNMGIGVISDFEDQPLIISSHLGVYAIVTVGAIWNLESLAQAAVAKGTHFSEMSGGHINPTELVATLINQGGSYTEGIRIAQNAIEGSCSILLLAREGIYAARDKFGRTPIALARGSQGWAATFETCALPNLSYQLERQLGPGEIVCITPEGVECLEGPLDKMQICTFLWVYYGYPASSYEGINVEASRYRCGAALAGADNIEVDCVAGIPDSGTGHGLGYANAKRIPYNRPFVKYTPSWPRSFMPQIQSIRDLVARMKLIPIHELIHGQRLLFCEDSIVRGTQLRDTVQRLFDSGAMEIHMRPACPPLLFGCRFLNFSRSRSIMDLASRIAIRELDDGGPVKLEEYVDPQGEKHQAMIERIRRRLNLTSLKYQRLEDLIGAIGLPKDKLCTYCWDGICDGCGNTCSTEHA